MCSSSINVVGKFEIRQMYVKKLLTSYTFMDDLDMQVDNQCSKMNIEIYLR